MSVITTVQAVPNRLRLIFEYFCGKSQSEPLERIENIMSPPALRRGGSDGDNGADMLRATLSEAYALRMVEEVEGKLCFAGSALDKKQQDIDFLFVEWIESRLLDPGVSADYRQEKVAFAIAWLLMQSPLRPLSFQDNYSSIIRQQLGENADVFDLTNKERFQNLAYWTRYLGYCTMIGNRAVVPDPTVALERWLPKIFETETEMSIDNFTREMGLKIPVLEDGAVRRRVEGDVIVDSLRRDPQRLSQSTSLALRRLSERGRIGFKDLSDANSRTLDLGDKIQRVSHIVMLEGKV